MAVIFTHLDADGVCAASLVKMTKEYKHVEVFFTHPAGLFQDIKRFDEELIILDIALDTRAFPDICLKLAEVAENYPVTYIDHHAIPGKLPTKVISINDPSVSTTELVFRYFYYQLPKNADHIAIIGAICDYLDDTPLMQTLLHHYERRTMFLDAGLLAQGLKEFGNGPDYPMLRNLVNKFSEGYYPCDIKDLTRAALNETRKDKHKRLKVLKLYTKGKNIAWIIDPPIGSRSKVAHWIMGDANVALGMCIRKLNHNRQLADITIRGINLFDLRDFIPLIAEKYGGSAGGHANAIGVRIPDRNIMMFLRAVENYIDDLKHIEIPELRDLIPIELAK